MTEGKYISEPQFSHLKMGHNGGSNENVLGTHMQCTTCGDIQEVVSLSYSGQVSPPAAVAL